MSRRVWQTVKGLFLRLVCQVTQHCPNRAPGACVRAGITYYHLHRCARCSYPEWIPLGLPPLPADKCPLDGW